MCYRIQKGGWTWTVSLHVNVSKVYGFNVTDNHNYLSFEFATIAKMEVKLHLSYSQNHAKILTSKVGVGNQQPFPSHGS